MYVKSCFEPNPPFVVFSLREPYNERTTQCFLRKTWENHTNHLQFNNNKIKKKRRFYFRPHCYRNKCITSAMQIRSINVSRATVTQNKQNTRTPSAINNNKVIRNDDLYFYIAQIRLRFLLSFQ